MHNSDQMAAEKLSDGIRLFATDLVKVEDMVRKRLKERVSKGHEKIVEEHK